MDLIKIQGMYKFFAVGLFLFVVSCSYNPFDPHLPRYTVTLTSGGNGNVLLSSEWSKIPAGGKVTLIATPDSGYIFIGFYGDAASTENPFDLVVRANLTITARFAKIPNSAMAPIPSSGKTFVMGSESPASESNERKAHKVSFTYNYFMAKYEVTQGEFKSLMGKNPSVDNALQGTFGVGDSFPVNYVSWYDAALFCNAKSKKEGLDTVYSYTAICGANQNCPYVLENLQTHFDRMGYRLPTEAEWEFAARAGTTSDYAWGNNGEQDAVISEFAWYAQNSGAKSHPVGKLAPNPFGIWDMAGNVSEFVNDWLGPYGETQQVNPIGPTGLAPEIYEATFQRPVRGGCFELGDSYLRPSSRSEPYPMPAMVVSRHVGFRIAMGVFFPDSVWHQSTDVPDSLGIAISCAKSDLISFAATSHIKIVFVKDDGRRRRLCYIDFTQPSLAVRELRDTMPAYGPSISPNGSYVAYSSQGIGFNGPSMVTIRALSDSSQKKLQTQASPAYLPNWWTDTISPDTFVVYTTAASMNNLPVWKTEKTMMRRVSGLSFTSIQTVLADTGSFPAGMSKNAEYLASGYPNAYLYDRKFNDLIRFFVPPFSGRDDTAQVCNVSISPGQNRPDELLFLDFGYSKTSTVVGKPYGFHSILFRQNSVMQGSGRVFQWYEVPTGFSEWDDVRWSNHPDFAIAIARNSDGANASVVCINLKDSTYLKIAEGEGLSAPYLWADPADISEAPDPYHSFAQYDVIVRVYSQTVLTEKLKLFWVQHADLTLGIVGSSPTLYGVDPHAMPSFHGVNMATLMGEHLLSKIVTLNYLLPQAPRLKAVIMGLDPGFLDTDYHPDSPFLNGLSQSEGYQFDQKNNFWRNGLPTGISKKIVSFSSSEWQDFDSAGFEKQQVAGAWGAPLIDKTDYSFADTFVQVNLANIKFLADTLASLNKHLVVVEYPENPAYKTTNSAGRYGPSWTTYAKIVDYLHSIETMNPYFHFYDANNYGNHDYSDADALDANHLGYAGAQKLSHRLDSLLSLYVK